MKKLTFIGIEGAPGMGKTSLLKLLHYTLSEPKSQCIPIHINCGDDNQTIKSIISAAISRGKVPERIVLLIDDVHKLTRSNNDLHNVITRKLIPECQIVATSRRPFAELPMIKDHLQTVFVMTGFSQGTAQLYLYRFFGKKTSKDISDLICILKGSVIFSEIARIPLCLKRLCQMFKANRQSCAYPSDLMQSIVNDTGLNANVLFVCNQVIELERKETLKRCLFSISNVLLAYTFAQELKDCSIEQVKETASIALTGNRTGKPAHLLHPYASFFMLDRCNDRSIVKNVIYGVQKLNECGFDCSQISDLFFEMKRSSESILYPHLLMPFLAEKMLFLSDYTGKYYLEVLLKLVHAVYDKTNLPEVPLKSLNVFLQLTRIRSHEGEMESLMKLLSHQGCLIDKLDLRISDTVASCENLRHILKDLTNFFVAILARNCNLHITLEE